MEQQRLRDFRIGARFGLVFGFVTGLLVPIGYAAAVSLF